ncbi:hypothetical protein M426DRAFT_151065 [Hypoxylon sp. CI-4A]|nr:hypothetical protein M426DRAFT_151065 [Hypoxylon sp. CI-4A]
MTAKDSACIGFLSPPFLVHTVLAAWANTCAFCLELTGRDVHDVMLLAPTIPLPHCDSQCPFPVSSISCERRLGYCWSGTFPCHLSTIVEKLEIIAASAKEPFARPMERFDYANHSPRSAMNCSKKMISAVSELPG